MEYRAVIRTLGTAGEKYQTLLDSLDKQTLRPKKILVYIPHGYDLPKETVGWEEYIRCEKGMVKQRSLPFDEVDTEYILFCDDDLELEPTAVERLFLGLKAMDGDCISPNVFPNEKMSFKERVMKAISGYAFPRRDDGWAFRIMRNSGYTYNSNPKADVMPSESAAGPCCLIKKEAYQAIHFEDERWIEDFGFPLGDDLLFYNKLHIMGRKLLVHYDSGIRHLDARVGSSAFYSDRFTNGVALQVVLPYRICYQRTAGGGKSLCLLSCGLMFAEQLLFTTVRYLLKERRFVAFDFVRGIRKGLRYIRSERYRRVPRFDAYI